MNAWKAALVSTDACAREASKLHVCGTKWPLRFVEEVWMKKRMDILMGFEYERAHQICSFIRADKFGIMSHSKKGSGADAK